MIDTTTLQSELSAVTKNLIHQFTHFPATAFTTPPAQQCWSAAELAEHLLMVVKNTNKVLRAEGSAPDRAPDKKVAVIKMALINDDTKRVAPETVWPTGKVDNQSPMIEELHRQMLLLNDVVTEKELTELCTVFPHPALGRLTRLEWIYFIIYHTQRHLAQLERIRQAVV